MSRREEIQHSILTVSGAERFFSIIRSTLQRGVFMPPEFLSNAAAARRNILDRYYDIVVIHPPLADESGIQLAIDVKNCCSASVLLVVPAGNYEDVLERVTDHGILVIARPYPAARLNQALRFLLAQQAKLRSLERKLQAAQEKTEEIRLVDKAKFLLMEREHMSEDEAHRTIGKQAMDHGTSRKRIAQGILDKYEGD